MESQHLSRKLAVILYADLLWRAVGLPLLAGCVALLALSWSPLTRAETQTTLDAMRIAVLAGERQPHSSIVAGELVLAKERTQRIIAWFADRQGQTAGHR